MLGGIGTLFQSVDRSVTPGKAPEAPRQLGGCGYPPPSRHALTMQTEALLTNAPAAASMRAPSRPSLSVSIRRVPTALLVVYTLLLALGLGLGSAYWASTAIRPSAASGSARGQAWPKLGAPEADPYMRAIIARRGDVPLATGEGLGFTASADSEGRPLDSRLFLHASARSLPLPASGP